MTAEDRLKELYEKQQSQTIRTGALNRLGPDVLRVSQNGEVYLVPEHIDLIAGLVIERIRNELSTRSKES